MVLLFLQSMKFLPQFFGLLMVASALHGMSEEQMEFFENKIRPVLAESCYECHNSVNKQKAGLALDYRDALLAGSDDGEVVVPGDPEGSVLIWAIRHQDGYEMPKSGPKLEDTVIGDFEEWIRMGAPDPRDKKPTQLDLDNAVSWESLLDKRSEWWSFQPLKKTKPPKVADKAWSENPIDRFILEALEEQGLEPQTLADPEVLVRRVHLVLTGLPPKPKVVIAFLKDPSSLAYRNLVDDLLASHAYGERWARHWMDWYRYSESHGSEGDPKLPYASIYRDYLIRALNEDVPYNQLLREHIAGDLLKRPRINQELEINESAIGPAHLRMVPHGFGVTDVYQEQISNIDNQIDVISKAMLGITVSCARCHNHKFDPISQKDFYRFYGILASNRPGTLNVDTPEKQNLHKRALARMKPKIQKAMADYWLGYVDKAVDTLAVFPFEETAEDKELITELAKDKKRRKKVIPTDPVALNQLMLKAEMSQIGSYHPFSGMKEWLGLPATEIISLLEEQKVEYGADLKINAEAKRSSTFYADLRDQATYDTWYKSGNGLETKVSPAGSFAVAGEGGSAVTGIYPAGIYTHLISSKHNATLASPYHVAKGDFSFVNALGGGGALRMSARNYPLDQGLHPYNIAESGDLALSQFKKYTFWNDEIVHYQFNTANDRPVGRGEDRSWFGVTEVIAGDVNLKNLGTPLFTVLENTSSIVDRESLLRAYGQALRESILAWKRSSMGDAQARLLSAFMRFNFLPNEIADLPPELARLIRSYRELENEIPEPTRAPGLLEGDIINQPLLLRGDYKQEGEEVPRQFLEVFSSKPYSDKNSGRLELANDITGRTNTLKSRVLVNRLWSYVFGNGIVASTDNFGRLGKTPTHPGLLDYVVLDFEGNGWSIKNALRQMILSRTFRSASSAPSGVLEKDPENLYLSYFTPRRLDAEAIMDSVNSVARNDFQRSVYKPVIRNKLDPFLSAFNLPIPTSTISKRDSTNVPAQALTMMNGAFVQESARMWANNVQSTLEGASTSEKIKALFMTAFSRQPTTIELDQLLEYHASNSNADTALNNITFALLNTKEFIYVY